jgi:protoheme IX farnesyltransferase
VASVSVRARLDDFKELLKPGISGFVVVTAAAGYLLGAPGSIDWGTLIGLLLGTALTSGGSGALNHVAESRLDALMHRTQDRPIPSGRIGAGLALAYGLAFAVSGIAVLGLTTNTLTTVLAAATVALYILVYTPLKRRTPHNTLVGAVPGALPALGGVTAATGTVTEVGLVAFGILFLWQLPHFYALAWMLREDYARGGFRMLPSEDPTGVSTGRMALGATLLLLVVGTLPTALGAAGWLYLIGMAGLGTLFTIPAFSFSSEPTDRRARRLLMASIIYLPVFFALVLLDYALR